MSDHYAYRKFTGKAEFEKAINSLLGLIEGIAIDTKINHNEISFLQAWLDDHQINSGRHPFNELFPVIKQAVADGVLTEEERADISWLCKRLTSAEYFNAATADMQKLHAIVAGIASDGEISVEELKGLASWLGNHEHLKRCWPYDEIESLVTSVLMDKKIDPEEHQMLTRFFGEFVSLLDNKTIVSPVFIEGSNLVGLCAVCPEISFAGAIFCLTGQSHKYTRAEFEEQIAKLGCKAVDGVSKKVDYLVVGADGNPCWAYACYGRKVEKAVELRKAGHSIVIVHENDFHDAVYDQ
jgi:NAD-dependent DNA ligase